MTFVENMTVIVEIYIKETRNQKFSLKDYQKNAGTWYVYSDVPVGGQTVDRSDILQLK